MENEIGNTYRPFYIIREILSRENKTILYRKRINFPQKSIKKSPKNFTTGKPNKISPVNSSTCTRGRFFLQYGAIAGKIAVFLHYLRFSSCYLSPFLLLYIWSTETVQHKCLSKSKKGAFLLLLSPLVLPGSEKERRGGPSLENPVISTVFVV